ncbi:hypothetical protein [Chthonobacter albigriseus]|uniref:hypothetical protein n=1 Tax=Chthonobacter albigriseus TaxID=1683161 RepID=UPI0015EF9E31|nr:hypothetical protein [Chthonobacter albigriseus]
MAIALAIGRNAPVLARQPERLVVEGLRHWLNGYSTGSIDCWELGWELFAREIGPRDARRLLGELSWWVREIRRAAGKPLACFPYGCQCICRDECLALTLVAAAQNGDADTIAGAARHLVGEEATDTALAATRGFGEALDELHQRLLPIPMWVVDDIAERPPLTRVQ